ncbi:GapA-binding peptide SR1P [Rossellomorea marisflavi]
MNVMGTIVCQSCLNTIEHYEDEKVSVLFSNCCTCEHDVELDD